MLFYRELRRGAEEKVSLLLNGQDYAIWTHNGKEGMQTGGIFETERQARDWLNGNLADFRAKGYIETPESLARQEYIVGRGRARRFWVVAPEGLWRFTYWGTVGDWNSTRQHRCQFPTAEELQQSCERLRQQRLRMGYRLVDRTTHRC
jgi:predicted DNA-binding WGR domain protein